MIFWFERGYPVDINKLNNDLVYYGFDGVMFPYQVFRNDYFTKISKNINNSLNLNYIVAIRPYAISPQYLSMICASINEMSNNKIFINLVSGEIDEHEKEYGGIIEAVNDKSSKEDRHKYIIKYLDEINKLKYNKPDIYVSSTKKYTLDEYYSKGFKCMVPHNRVKLENLKQGSVLSVQPKFPNNYLFDLITRCEEMGVHVLLSEEEINTEKDNIFNFIKDYNERKK